MRANRGFTLVEMVVGAAILGAMALVTAGLFRAGAVTYRYTMNQLIFLNRSWKAVGGDGNLRGLLWSIYEARSVAELSRPSLVLNPPEGPSVRYYTTGSILYQSQFETPAKQAEGVQSLDVRYYNLDNQGMLVESLSPASASLAFVALNLEGCAQRQCTYFTSAALRNRP